MEDGCHHLPNGINVVTGETNCLHCIIHRSEVSFVIDCSHLVGSKDIYIIKWFTLAAQKRHLVTNYSGEIIRQQNIILLESQYVTICNSIS